MSDAQVSEPTSQAVEYVSLFPFEATLERLTKAIAERGMTAFATIDHAANARTVGMSMPPTTLILYGAAKAGTPVMLAAPLAALDLPLRVLVRQREDATVAIAFHPVVAMLGRAGVPEAAAARLTPAQQMLIAAVTA